VTLWLWLSVLWDTSTRSYRKRGARYAICALLLDGDRRGQAPDRDARVEKLAADAKGLVDAAVQRYGRIDVVINNAGLMPQSPLERLKSCKARKSSVIGETG
jgi:NAD(P)-dependent dehydrogenase (short-subunit alcohol dehydrogenase family)